MLTDIYFNPCPLKLIPTPPTNQRIGIKHSQMNLSDASGNNGLSARRRPTVMTAWLQSNVDDTPPSLLTGLL
jgi:hypothetical protein